MINFIKKYNKEIIQLKKEFNKLSAHKWSALTVMNEFLVQIGHLSTFEIDSEIIKTNRNINDLSNEIIDNVMQIILVADRLEIDWDSLKIVEVDGNSVLDMVYLLGTLTEAVLEKYGYRYLKQRKNFETIDDFILQTINELISVFDNFIKLNSIDLEIAYKDFLQESQNFLNFKLTSLLE